MLLALFSYSLSKCSSVKLIELLLLNLFLSLELHHVIELALYHALWLNQILTVLLLFQVPLFDLLRVLLLDFFHFLLSDLSLYSEPLKIQFSYHSFSLLLTYWFFNFLEMSTFFTRFYRPLRPIFLLLLLLHPIVLKHPAVKHHVHVLFKQSWPLPHVSVIVKLLLHLLLLKSNLFLFFLDPHILFHVLVLGEESPFIHAWWGSRYYHRFCSGRGCRSRCWRLEKARFCSNCSRMLMVWAAISLWAMIKGQVLDWITKGLRKILLLLLLVLMIHSLRWHRSSLVEASLYCLKLTCIRFDISMCFINIGVPSRCSGLSDWDIVILGCNCRESI